MLAFYMSLADSYDRSLLEQIYNNYRKQMFYLARTIVKSDEDAEDVVHDVFCSVAVRMQVIRNAPCEKDRRNYLLKATKNKAINALHKRNIRIDYNISISDDADSMSDKDFLDELCNRIQADKLLEVMKELDGKYCEVLYYHFVLGLSVKDTAELLGRNMQTVAKQISRGKALLLNKADFGKEGGDGE